MARLVRHDQMKPYRIDPADFPKDGKPIWICACGLSATMPYCDKAHKGCVNEQHGPLHIYDPHTRQVIDQRPDPNPGPPPAPPASA